MFVGRGESLCVCLYFFRRRGIFKGDPFAIDEWSNEYNSRAWIGNVPVLWAVRRLVRWRGSLLVEECCSVFAYFLYALGSIQMRIFFFLTIAECSEGHG